MPCTRHIIICEGESERAYLQRLQSFLDAQPLVVENQLDTPLRFIVPERVIVKTGTFGKLKSRYNATRKSNKKAPSIQIWADFDLYHRNDKSCATLYAAKTAGVPDFLFSFHNFEDFFALHWSGERFEAWLEFGNRGHFAIPLHSDGYVPEIKKIFPEYEKGTLPAGFITWDALKILKTNKAQRPTSNPHALAGVRCFADFLIGELEKSFPGKLE